TSAFVASVVLLLVLAPGRSSTAENHVIATSSSEPVKVLAVNLKTSKTNTIEGLELQVQNTSDRPIQYLVIYAEVPTAKDPIRVPLTFGNAPVPNSREKMELLQPGARLTLTASKNACERLATELATRKHVPSSKQIQTTINGVIFADRSAWTNGQMNYPDPENGWHWIAASELARKKRLEAEGLFGVKFSRADYKENANSRICFRNTGADIIPCCDGRFALTATFQEDFEGNEQPVLDEACCSQGNCCDIFVSGPCSP
ncbi:MAG TPA: hypothetical protein VHH35_08445, partial [Pyrinomonadaceae bacterium]|nr:hypothetical protein [Pyrinomonadaceae bacterium]